MTTYVKIGKVLVDCNDIKAIQKIGYGLIEGSRVEVPVYRILFKDGTFWEKALDQNTIDIYNKYVTEKEAPMKTRAREENDKE